MPFTFINFHDTNNPQILFTPHHLPSLLASSHQRGGKSKYGSREHEKFKDQAGTNASKIQGIC